jgi:hypothetical protein
MHDCRREARGCKYMAPAHASTAPPTRRQQTRSFQHGHVSLCAEGVDSTISLQLNAHIVLAAAKALVGQNYDAFGPPIDAKPRQD